MEGPCSSTFCTCPQVSLQCPQVFPWAEQGASGFANLAKAPAWVWGTGEKVMRLLSPWISLQFCSSAIRCVDF